eukprot:gnl/TRDRNA2_/TRDRNA2_190620_c0_seq1.p1 gnl/TRDRNA2_/TRDRNA2_190620_c0~~gnl/TRDRNA2_/TRDRNA2_190620_c0_seq1.p1  ORF type:complete len:119 (-),score=10.14 gnl/TRDRNA2_/TRDRNA2_190620_c0_seq1:72-428(-)
MVGAVFAFVFGAFAALVDASGLQSVSAELRSSNAVVLTAMRGRSLRTFQAKSDVLGNGTFVSRKAACSDCVKDCDKGDCYATTRPAGWKHAEGDYVWYCDLKPDDDRPPIHVRSDEVC